MARIPDSATLIDNPVSIAPGFSGKTCMYGRRSSRVQAMVASVLPTLTGGAPMLSQTLRIDRGEGDIAGPLSALATDFADLSIGSIRSKDGKYGANIVIRGQDMARIDRRWSGSWPLFP
jgi:molybdopterin-biosynthesis enzyme MoeA-like protein